MAEVIRLSDKKPITPKQVAGNDGKHRYTVTFDPNGSLGSNWVWQVEYVRVYSFYGATSTQSSAVKEARKQILAMNKHTIAWEETHE